jgi:light-independent protochlorophyllide reductase subunit B
MQLAVWTYEGPPHVGAMRVATAMEGVHYVLHRPRAIPTPICCSR